MKRCIVNWQEALVRSLALLAAIVALSGCSKDDIATSQDLIIYMPSGTTANSREGTFVTARDNIIGDSGVAFPVLITRAFDRDVQVTGSIDTSLLAEYDRQNNTESPKITAGSFVLAADGIVRIMAGQERSVDSLRVEIGPQAGSLDLTKQYVLPIRLTSTDSNLKLSSNRSVMYLRITFNKITTQITGLAANRLIPININRTPDGDVVSGNLNFEAAINVALGEQLSVSVQDREDLIASYNQTNQTNYVAFPTGTYAFTPNATSIASGALTAEEPFSLALSNTSAFETGRTYLLPIGIVDEGPVPPDAIQGTAYFTVHVAVQNIDPTNPTPPGNRVDRSSWTATASSTDAEFAPGGTPAMAFDDDPATGWHSEMSAPNVVFTLDMQMVKNIRGFSFTPRYWEYFNSILISAATGMEIFSSNNGVDWISQGAYTTAMPAGSSSQPQVQNLTFFKPVQARFFRFKITQYSSYMPGFGEINAFE